MAISVADNFSYKGSKPLDARIQYSTVANMKNATTSDLYDGCLAYVTETKKNYQYDSTNSVDPTTGKWRELQTGGGGGSSTFSDLTDVSISNVQNGQVPKWNSQTSKWENANFDTFDMSSLSVDSLNFSLSEKVIGTWIDGKPLYQKTVTGTTNSNANPKVILTDSSIDKIVDVLGYVAPSGVIHFINWYYADTHFTSCWMSNGELKLQCQNSTDQGKPYAVTLMYTKTTDSAVASGEKIIGTWVNGKPLYQQVFSVNINLPSPSTTSTSWINSGLSAVGIDSIISGSMIDSDGQYFIANFCKMNSNTNIGFFPLYYVGARTIVNVTLQYTKSTD